MAKTDLLATILLNKAQCHLIRLRFYKCEGWKELKKCFPQYKVALKKLPDTTALRQCNVMFQEMVVDTIKLFGISKRAKQKKKGRK